MNAPAAELNIVQPCRLFSLVDSKITTVFVACADAMVLFYFGYFSYLNVFIGKIEFFPMYLATMAQYSVLTILLLHSNNLYKFESIFEYRMSFSKIYFLFTFRFMALLAMAFALNNSNTDSITWAFYWLISSIIGIWLIQLLARQCFLSLVQCGWLVCNLAIVGAGEQSILFVDRLKKVKHSWLQIIGIFDDRSDRVSGSINGNLMLGGVDTLISMARIWHIDEILIALPWGVKQRVLAIINELQVHPADIRLCLERICSRSPSGYSYNFGILISNMFDKPILRWNYVIKDLEDKILVINILTLISPILIVIAPLIKQENPRPHAMEVVAEFDFFQLFLWSWNISRILIMCLTKSSQYRNQEASYEYSFG